MVVACGAALAPQNAVLPTGIHFPRRNFWCRCEYACYNMGIANMSRLPFELRAGIQLQSLADVPL